MAGGNHQIYREDYLGTYAPVVSFNLARIFLYVILCMNMYVLQVDIETAFLYGDLKEGVWLMSTSGFPCLKLRC